MRELRPAESEPAPDAPGLVPALSLSPVLDTWRTAGRELVSQQLAEFNELLEPIEPLLRRGNFAAAAAAAQVAANYAAIWHPGVFTSAGLERALQAIGEAALPHPGAGAGAAIPGRPLRVLHVTTQLGQVGGHVRMLWRWIDRDADNVHSVALTRQTSPAPERVASAVAARGGRLHYVNRRLGGLIEWARELQLHLNRADLVVLNVFNQDVIPFLALAGMSRRPPVLLLDHTDHVFWLGTSFADLVVNTRLSGRDVCRTRRGISEDRSLLLPICLEPQPRRLSRPDAKRALGLPTEGPMILTIARAVKFRSLGGLSFADAFVPVLTENPRARLVVIGPGGSVDWSAAQAAVPGQILVFPERVDTQTFYEAADVYADSFPFSSNTSLLEAGLRGVPLVTRYPFSAGCEVMGADSLGLDSVMIRTSNVAEFQQALSLLLSDAKTCAELGARTQASIETVNGGPVWDEALTRIYRRALQRPRQAIPPPLDEAPRFHDLDVLLPFVFGTAGAPSDRAVRLANAREIGLKTMPPLARTWTWARMAWRREFRFRTTRASWRYLVPEWMTVRSRAVAAGGRPNLGRLGVDPQ